MSKHELIIPKEWQGRKAKYIALCCNNHEALIKNNDYLLTALRYALDNGGFFPEAAEFLSSVYDKAEQAIKDAS